MSPRRHDPIDSSADGAGDGLDLVGSVDDATRASSAYAPRHARKRRRRVLPLVAIALVAVLVAGGGYVAYSYQRFVGGVTRIDAIPAPSGTPGDGDSADDLDGQDQNILLVGDDRRPANATPEELQLLGTEDDGGSLNTDTMIVLHLPADGSSATMIQFPRDSWVDIPGHGKNKLNAAFVLGSQGSGGDAGGAQLLITTIQNLTGLSIDHYMQVSLFGFYKLVEALGPVNVCLNEAVNDHWSGLVLPAGESSLNPSQALSFVRQRHGLPNGDLDRQVRQQYFLTTEARQILSAGTLLNPIKSGKVLDAVSSSMTTDSGLDFLALANQMKNLRPESIRSATVPITGTPTLYVNGRAVSTVALDFAAMPGFIQELVGPPKAYTDAVAAAPAGTTVTVQNASGVTGAATAASATLAAAGFDTTAPESAASTVATVVRYPAGKEAQAKAVAATVPGAIAVVSTTVQGVTLVLGTDGRVPVDTSAAPPAGGDAGSAGGAPSGDGAGATPSDSASAPDATAGAPSASPSVGTTYGDGACIN